MYQLALIYRGQGKVYDKEHASYHPNVDVYFQKKAWADRPFVVDWYKRTLQPWVQENVKGTTQDQAWVLYADSLDAQRAFDFVNCVHKDNGRLIYGPRGKTDGWQPIDVGGLGAIFKALFRMEQEHWMDLTYKDEKTNETLPNWRRWESSLTASHKRILTSWWAGQAYEKFVSQPYDHARESSFFRGGCTAGAPDHDKARVQVQGLHRPFEFTDATAEFGDKKYWNDAYSGSGRFDYSDQKAGGEDRDDQDSDSSSSSTSHQMEVEGEVVAPEVVADGFVSDEGEDPSSSSSATSESVDSSDVDQ
jgi:hypothetical protein